MLAPFSLHHQSTRWLVAAMACAMAASSVGCQTIGGADQAESKPLDLTSAMPWNSDEAEELIGTPERIVATWSEAVLHQPGEKGQRGFGGRLFFYDRHSTKPIRVSGQLVVYAFDEEEREATNHRPTKRFVFPIDQFAKHETESEVGTSYSVWLPWGLAGGFESEISLIARFEPSQGGGLVVSEQTRHRLPGMPRVDTLLATKTSLAKKTEGDSGNLSSRSQVRQASVTEAGIANQGFANQAGFEQPSDERTQPQARMSATTISLPPRFMRTHRLPQARVTQQRLETQQLTKPESLPPKGEDAAKVSLQDSVKKQLATAPKTKVTYLTAEESVRRSLRSRSFGSLPKVPQDQATPAAERPFASKR